MNLKNQQDFFGTAPTFYLYTPFGVACAIMSGEGLQLNRPRPMTVG